MLSVVGELAGFWVRSATAVGVNWLAAKSSGEDLERRYAEPHRHYHRTSHVLTVIHDATELAAAVDLPAGDRHLLTLAACAHDVVYNGQSGDDEQASAAWAARHLSGVAQQHRDRVTDAVLATITHLTAGDDPIAPLLLDADLSILAATPVHYDEYVAAVRLEYAGIPEELWRPGRAAVLRSLVDKPEVFITAEARKRWEQPARDNVARELVGLNR